MATARLCPLARSLALAASLLLTPLIPLLASSPALAAPAEPAPRRVNEPPPVPDNAAPKPDPPGASDGTAGDAAKPPAEDNTPKEMTPPIKKKNLSHRLQVSVDIAVGVGAAFMITYEDTTWCGQGDPAPDNDSFCTGLAPVYMDFGLGFSVLHWLEILVDFRLGVMDDMVGNRPLMLMPGLRLWMDFNQPYKIGLALQMVVDLTQQDQPTNVPPNGQDMDLGFRFYAQFQYDFLRYIGLFGRIGLLGTFQKWIGFNLEAQFGVQARFP